MPLSMKCHGSAMAPTATSKVAMGAAVVASGSNFVPVSSAVEDQRDEAPSFKAGNGQGLEASHVNPFTDPVAGLLPPKAGPVAIITKANSFKFGDDSGTAPRQVAANATSYPRLKVVMSADSRREIR